MITSLSDESPCQTFRAPGEWGGVKPPPTRRATRKQPTDGLRTLCRRLVAAVVQRLHRQSGPQAVQLVTIPSVTFTTFAAPPAKVPS